MGPKQRGHARALIASLAIVFALLIAAWGVKPKPSEAYPTFAQALGVNCSMCHTMVPELNAYGRYLQRTWYAPLTQQALKNTFPAFLWYQAAGNNVGNLDAAQAGKKAVLTDVFYIYFVGFMGPEFTYRVENNMVSADQLASQSTGPETMWLAYHGLFGGYGHLQAGVDYPGPVPAALANPSDYEAAFHLRHLAIGKDSYNLINKRLTFRFDYEKGPIDAEVAWRGGTNNPIAGGASDFAITPGSNHAFPQWKVAYAPPNRPFEIGDFGILGTYDTTNAGGIVDHYWQNAPYFQVDPGWVGKGSPGIFFFDAWGHDSNPGIGTTPFPEFGPTYHDAAAELMEPILKGTTVLTAREEWVNTGLTGAIETHYGLVGASFQPFPKLFPWAFGRFDVPMGAQSSAPFGRPTFQWAFQMEPPLSGPLTHPFDRVKEGSSTAVAMAKASPMPPSGAALYNQNCAACHQMNGQGYPPTYPSLVKDAMVTSDDATAVSIVVKKGTGEMPAYGNRLSDEQLAAILTYIRGAWGNSAGPVTADQVAGTP